MEHPSQPRRSDDLATRIVAHMVPDPTDLDDPATRAAYGRLSSVTCVLLNVLLSIGKGAAGVLAGSVSVVADAINNLSDASSNVVALIGFRLASRPADEGHPFGHGRFEYLAGLAVAMLIVVMGAQLGRSSIEHILWPTPTDFNVPTVLALGASILVKLGMIRLNHSMGRRTGSKVLEATAIDSRNDVITTSVVLAAGIVSQLTDVQLDGWASLGVAVLIVASGIGLMRDTVNPLLGQTPSTALVRRVYDRIMGYPSVLGTHDLLIHDYGPGRQFASAHVEMAADTTVRHSHEVLDLIERDLLREEGLRIVLHCDPIETTNGLADLRNWLAARLAGIDPSLSVHDVEVTHPVAGGPAHVSLDCYRPERLPIDDDELRRRITDAVLLRYPDASCDIVIDMGFVSPLSP